MKYKSYKFWCIHREDDVHIDWACIRFFEGEYQKKKDEDNNDIDVYVRTKRLKKVDLSDLGTIKIKKDKSGEDTVLYTDKDFGTISTNEELREFINKQLDKVKGLESIAEQKWQN